MSETTSTPADDGPADYDPFFAARPRATTSADPKEQEKAEKARGREQAPGQVKSAVEKGEVTAEDALAQVIASGRRGKQDGALTRWLQAKIAEGAAPAEVTVTPPEPQHVDPTTINPDGDTRLNPAILAPTGGGAVPSVGARGATSAAEVTGKQ